VTARVALLFAGLLDFAANGADAQDILPPPVDGEMATFGTTVVASSGLKGRIYFLKPGAIALPKFEKLEPVGTIYTNGLNIPPRDFEDGFPGVTNRFEWFAIDYRGRFYIDQPGKYRFILASDDGSKLYIDDKVLINNDGIHSVLAVEKSITLAGGIHRIRISYFQGPRYSVALMLGVWGPGDSRWRAFNTNEFKPPANPADWKYGSPDDLKDEPDPDAGRKKLKDVLKQDAPK
jgi:hypothetical protein